MCRNGVRFNCKKKLQEKSASENLTDISCQLEAYCTVDVIRNKSVYLCEIVQFYGFFLKQIILKWFFYLYCRFNRIK